MACSRPPAAGNAMLGMMLGRLLRPTFLPPSGSIAISICGLNPLLDRTDGPKCSLLLNSGGGLQGKGRRLKKRNPPAVGHRVESGPRMESHPFPEARVITLGSRRMSCLLCEQMASHFQYIPFAELNALHMLGEPHNTCSNTALATSRSQHTCHNVALWLRTLPACCRMESRPR